MTERAVSVIVVSRGRPAHLIRCLTALAQLYYRNFEVIVVADPAGAEAVGASRFAGAVKLVRFDRANISAARNLGLAEAAGEVVAFIDDDAVAEPSWLAHLVRPFADAGVDAAGGFVRGRNGISFQSRGRLVDAAGRETPVRLDGDAPLHIAGRPGRAAKTEGTNCAFRRETLLRIGGFDPAFHFYLDETDVNQRLAALGARTVLVPLAEVHHGFAASAQRSAARVPRTLFDIGASLAVFLRKHAPDQAARRLDEMRAEQRARAIGHMVTGACEPRDVGRLMATLEAGFAEGRKRSIGLAAPLPQGASPAFRRFDAGDGLADGMAVIAGRSLHRARHRQRAAEAVAGGQRVSLFLFGPTVLYHRVRFDPAGYWEQAGGLFGRSERSDPPLRLTSFRARLAREAARVRVVRGLEENF